MGAVQICWLGQNGYMLRHNGKTLAIDPYLSDDLFAYKQFDPGFHRRYAPPVAAEAFSCDVLVATHEHIDHLDKSLIQTADERIGAYLCPPSCADLLLTLGVAEDKIIRFPCGAQHSCFEFTLTAVYACHTDDSIGIHIISPEGTLYFVGDSLLDERLLREAPGADVLFCCINGRLGNMDANDASTLARQLMPETVVPCHYDLFSSNSADPDAFCQLMKNTGVTPKIMARGEYIPLQELRR